MNFPFLDLAASVLFPRRCFGCRAAPKGTALNEAFCASCRGKIAIARTLFCGECGGRMLGGKARCHPSFPYILGAAARYDDRGLQALVHALKFRSARRAATPLVSLVEEYLLSVGTLFDGFHDFTVVPIPLSRRRLRARGFNQAELLARPVARSLGLPFDGELLARIRHTKPQTETKSARERRENLRGCFLVRRPLARANILLVDDVTTTGTTFHEAAATLKQAGAGTIVALAALRA